MRSSERRTAGRSTVALYLAGAATLLLVAQIATGTSVLFAGAVYLTNLIVIVTLQQIGFGSIAGVLIAVMAFRYVVFSQIAKMVLGQPGDSKLLAPEATIGVIFLGMAAICLAAILVSSLLGRRRIIAIEPSPEALVVVRNVCLVVGLSCVAVNRYYGVSSGSDEMEYGGIVGIARQLNMIVYFAILAETWRILLVSDGRHSLSLALVAIVALLTAIGFVDNSKLGVAIPFVTYLVGSAAFRRYVSKAQITVVLAAIVFGFLFIYPAVQILRGERGEQGLSVDTATDFVEQSLLNPELLQREWDAYRLEPDTSLMGESLHYLGFYDELMIRFMLIANTDAVVNAVNEDRPYGFSLVTDGFELLLPTFLDPSKPRVSTADRLTWHYGLRPWGLTGNPTVGIFGDSFAAMGWAGVTLIPFCIMLVLFTEIQLTGVQLAGNLVSCYFLVRNLWSFSESSSADFIFAIGRGNPIDLLFIIAMVYLAAMVVSRRRRMLSAAALAAEGRPRSLRNFG